jgi:hypothetical protein
VNRLIPLIVGTVLVGASAAEAVVFTEVTATALPDVASSPGRDSIPPKFTGGATVGDCDGDGLPDIYFTGSGHDVLYRNRGDGTFEDVTVAANLGYSVTTRGPGFADVDNDGDLDLYATGWSDGRHFLYINDGHCKFERGPTTDVRLQWASYYDAADQARISRLFDGIHPRVDDFTGRQVGSQIGIGAWELASTLRRHGVALATPPAAAGYFHSFWQMPRMRLKASEAVAAASTIRPPHQKFIDTV